jgi:hypothetical protein
MDADDYISPFSYRVERHPRVSSSPPTDELPLVQAIPDQLLVSQRAPDSVRRWLDGRATFLTTVFDGLPGADQLDDVEIWQLGGAQPNAIRTMQELQATVVDGHETFVSPNHVLVPASEAHGCPHGPPKPLPDLPEPTDHPGPKTRVTVIDSGYQWDDGWGENPLDSLCTFEFTDAQWLHDGKWTPGTRDVPDADGDGRLDTLAGHANFVAGLVAQGCAAEIQIWNHNGGFATSAAYSENVPTEAAVCRSIYMAQQATSAHVIVLGFAFASLNHAVHHMWDVTRIGDPLVVVPAGNQSSLKWRYPAALNGRYPSRYPNIVTVASHDKNDARSEFSNYGPWITCSAVGQDVESTFLRVDMELEDAPDEPKQNFANAWATWSGTSFAAPKVAAAICGRIAAGAPTAKDALREVLASGKSDPARHLGAILPF